MSFFRRGEEYNKHVVMLRAQAMRQMQEEQMRRMSERQDFLRSLYGTASVSTAPPPLAKGLVAGPIIGWRVWKIRTDGILLSVTQQCEWPVGTPLIGDPKQGGTEGVYATKTRDDLAKHPYGRDCIYGTVALWGKVIEHEKGYRAQYAYPLVLDLSSPSPMPGFPRSPRRSKLAESIRENYGCEVVE